MPSDRGADLQRAIRVMRRGRFSEAALILSPHVTVGMGRHGLPAIEALLADLLQRTGRNSDAEPMAVHALQTSGHTPDDAARCHFVLGNICRERGDTENELKHLQISTTMAAADLELSCWAQLRLMAAVADFSGAEAAIGRLDATKRTLARHGDARPFAALHLWLAELDTTQGCLLSASQHLRRAESLISQGDDIWLRGYFAINSSVVSYHCADIAESERAAQLALSCAEVSGHRATRRAAITTLGHIHLSRGNLSRAREYFEIALQCCEMGSVNRLAVFDSIAQVALQSGDLDTCRMILEHLETPNATREHSKVRHYRAWCLQTKLQLLLKQGKKKDARDIILEVKPQLNKVPQPRIDTVTYLSATETLIANSDLMGAANILSAMYATTDQAPPDLLAEMERVAAKTVGLAGDPALAQVHFERAVRTFEAIGHAVGRSIASSDSELVEIHPSQLKFDAGLRTSLDYVRALIDTRTRPELFGLEAAAWLDELDCAESFALDVAQLSCSTETLPETQASFSNETAIRLDLGSAGQRKFILSFTPRQDPVSMLIAFEFQRVVRHILSDQSAQSAVTDLDVLWASNDWASNDGTVFAAESMRPILKTVKTIGRTEVSVLITGETGAGKEIIARSIHEQSSRSNLPFTALNCAAVPKDLFESQLFGFKKGAFSGANESFQGVVRAATGGTLLLDEIGELSLDAQAKLLRFLELGEVHPIGEAYPTKVNVRMLFATNNDLEQAVKERRFREDLFYRINVISIRVPPLRERREEIPLLVNVFCQRFGREFSKHPPKFTQSAMETLVLYSWPGNVRQLSNEVRRITALVEPGTHVTPDLLSPEIVRHGSGSSDSNPGSPHVTIPLGQTLEQATAQLEREMVQHALKRANGQVVRAARTLGLSRKGLYLKRRRLGLADQDIPYLSS